MKHAPALVQLHSMTSRKRESHQTTASKSSLCKEDQWALAVVDRSNPLLWSQRLTESGPTRVRPAVGNCRAPGNHVGNLKLGETIAHEARSHSWGKMEVWKSSRGGRLPPGVCLARVEMRTGGQRGGSGRSRFGAIWRPASTKQTRPAGSSSSTIPMKWRPRRISKTVSRVSDPDNVIADRPVTLRSPGLVTNGKDADHQEGWHNLSLSITNGAPPCVRSGSGPDVTPFVPGNFTFCCPR